MGNFIRLGLVLLSAAGVTGCSQSTLTAAKVTGKVAYKGEPLTAGSITFYPKGGGGSFSAQFDDLGFYTINDMTVGDYVVSVETDSVKPDEATGATKGNESKYKAAGSSPRPDGKSSSQAASKISNTGKYTKIPAKYADKAKTTLQATIVAGPQTKNFELD